MARQLPPYRVKPGTMVEEFHKGGIGRNEFCRLLLGPFGCTSGDTEFLTPRGWKRIDEWEPEDLVAQWNPDGGTVSWTGAQHHDYPAPEPLIHFSNDSLSMVLSANHRVPLYDYRGQFVVKTAAEVEARPSRHTVPTTWIRAGAVSNEYWIRLLVAIEADGHLPKNSKQTVVTVRKERKKERIEWLLKLNGLDYKATVYKARPTETRYAINARLPKTAFTQMFWWRLSTPELEIVMDEIDHWDGHKSTHRVFASVEKSAADFIQFAAHATGRKATIRCVQPRKGKERPCYRVCISEQGGQKSKVMLRGDNLTIRHVRHERQYCFTVPTSFWIARHNDCIFVTGNSGKTVASVWDVFLASRSQPRQKDGKRRSRWAFVRNTKPMLRDMTIKTWLDWFPEDPSIGVYTSSIGQYMLTYEDMECEILFKALDDPDDVRNVLGLELTGAFLNEAREIQRPIWEGLSGRVGRYPRMIDIVDSPDVRWTPNPPSKPGRWWRRQPPSASITEIMLVHLDGKLVPTDDAYADVPLHTVVPGVEWAKAAWAGMIADSNPCSEGDYMYDLFEVKARNDPMIGALYKLYHQPPGLLNIGGKWRSNPHAENLDNLRPGYYLNQAIGKDPQWIKVYCLGQYGVVSDGQPVYPGYDDQWHCREFDYDRTLPVYFGWDFGVRGQACIMAQLSRRGQLRVLDECFAEDVSLESFVRDYVVPMLGKYPQAIYEHSACDPAGNKRSDTDATRSLEMLNDAYPGRELGLPFDTHPAPTNALGARLEAVKHFVNNTVEKRHNEPVGPKFLLHPRCTNLRAGFQGRYEFKKLQGADGRFKEVPDKNKWSHPADALQYLCSGILSTTDITGSEPDPYEGAGEALKANINGRRYSGY